MENYFNDLLESLVEQARLLKKEEMTDFELGALQGYYESISKILNQLEQFGMIEKVASKWQEFQPEELL